MFLIIFFLLLFRTTSCSILLNYEDVDRHTHTWDSLHYFAADVVVVVVEGRRDFVDAGGIVDVEDEDEWYYHNDNDMYDEAAYDDGVAFVV